MEYEVSSINRVFLPGNNESMKVVPRRKSEWLLVGDGDEYALLFMISVIIHVRFCSVLDDFGGLLVNILRTVLLFSKLPVCHFLIQNCNGLGLITFYSLC